ncbi:MAG: hypothetical protein AMS27_00100 [Bacteroides sp. SM23_62_1]|nr:MAG: hypothetical protein AMS27_00100 [Bacteroides sp. SM23_62_1]
MFRQLIFLYLSVLVLFSCQSRQGRQPGAEFEVPDSVLMTETLTISSEALEEIVQNVSSPIEMAALIKELGIPFSTKYLSTTDYVDKYNTSFKMAYSLGVFGADLGYLNIYDKSTQIVDYLTAINKLADGLKVGQFFDFNTLKRLATSRENIDSLMFISVNSFNNMDSYLRENNRGHLSALMIAGTWIEGMYLVTQVAEEKRSNELNERIGEQKINLNNIMLILNNYKDHEAIADMIKTLSELKNEFDNIEITYKMGEPETVEQDGMIMIVQKEESVVNITDNQLKNIIRKTEQIRNQLISI